MGTVFAATHLQLGGLVALKFLLPELASRPEIASRFLREARAGRDISSHHVAEVHDVDNFGDVPFIVMEHFEGETLAAHIARRGALPVDEAVDLSLQACDAVSESHTLGIVHRDVKPANLFLTKDRGGVTSRKVLDFGISKFEDVAATSRESRLGTPLYMSPEQVDDSAQVDARTDIWALGVHHFVDLTRGPDARAYGRLNGCRSSSGSSLTSWTTVPWYGSRAPLGGLSADDERT